MPHPIARREDFVRLSHEQQENHIALLSLLDKQRQSCRCEMIGGRDFTVVVGVGYSAPRYWADKFDVELDTPR